MTVYEQLTEYCDCLSVNNEDESYPAFTEHDVDELIALVSTYTCWAQKPCETFLKGERKELIDVKDCVCDCDIFEFEPFYRPFDPSSFTFTLIEQNGIEETSTSIDTFAYSTADEKFRLELPLPNCDCVAPRCGCKSNYKLLVTYEAGYEEIPECLLPFFCDMLQMIIDKNKCCCEECQECDHPISTEERLDYTKLEDRIKDRALEILTTQYIRQLSLISLCRYMSNLWGVVV